MIACCAKDTILLPQNPQTLKHSPSKIRVQILVRLSCMLSIDSKSLQLCVAIYRVRV